jgi:hypothetical protein
VVEPQPELVYGCVGKLVTPGDCKSSARKALLVRVQRHPPSLRVRLETGKLWFGPQALNCFFWSQSVHGRILACHARGRGSLPLGTARANVNHRSDVVGQCLSVSMGAIETDTNFWAVSDNGSTCALQA